MLTDIEKKILELKELGFKPKEIAKKLNLTRDFVYYRYKDSFKDVIERRNAKNANDETFEYLVKKNLPHSNSLNHLCGKLGLRGVEGYYTKIKKIIEKNNLDISHFGSIKRKSNVDSYNVINDEDFFSKDTNRNGTITLKRLILHGYKEWKCQKCGLTEWLNEKIPLQVHHINGNHYDNRLENLELLCPNCHAKTDNFCTKKQTNKENYCLNCGKELLFRTQKKFCSYQCSLDYKRLNKSFLGNNDTNRKTNIERKKSNGKLGNVTKEDLIDSFKKYISFTKVGEFYNVSDNGIRKLCKRYGLPTTRREMYEYLLNINKVY